MDEPPPTWVDRTEEIALPLYGFALGSALAGVDPLIVLAVILWWDARFARDPPAAAASAWWTALMVPAGPLAVAVAAGLAARSIRRPWYGWGGSIMAVGVFALRWNAEVGRTVGSMASAAAGAAIAAVLAFQAGLILERLTRFLTSTPLAPVVVGQRRTPDRLPDDDDFDSLP